MSSTLLTRRRWRTPSRALRPWLAGLLAVLLLALAACGGDGADEDSGGTATETGGGTEDGTEAEAGGTDLEVTELTIGTLPIVDAAALQIAVDDGLFEAEGLQVELESMAGGAAAIPGLVSGDLDVVVGNWISFFQAITEGIELRAIANGVRAQEQYTMLLAAAGSDLEGDPAGLEGRTVAVNTLSNLAELTLRTAVQEAGGDPDTVELVEIPFPEMIPALEGGDVDAAFAAEPFVTLGQQDIGAVAVADPLADSDSMARFPVSGFQVTAEFAEQNPSTVAAIQRALAAATEIASTETDRMTQEILPDLAGLEPEVAEALHLPEFRIELDVQELQRVVDVAYDFGVLPEQLDAGEYIVAPEPVP